MIWFPFYLSIEMSVSFGQPTWQSKEKNLKLRLRYKGINVKKLMIQTCNELKFIRFSSRCILSNIKPQRKKTGTMVAQAFQYKRLKKEASFDSILVQFLALLY